VAELLPFRAYRYDPAVAGDLAALVCPPYDVIPEEHRETLHRRHPYNAIRLILGEDLAGDDARENRYARAGRYFGEWVAGGILIREPAPAFYLSQQTFRDAAGRERTRTGLVAAVRLQPYGTGVIFPHEQTFPGPKEDRLRLMRAMPANLEQILVLYDGPADPLRTLWQRVAGARPVADFRDDLGARNRLWVIRESEALAAIPEGFRDRRLFIADGHHRYEAALLFREERRSTDPAPPALQARRAYHYVTMHLVHIEDPGLVILPTHRLLAPFPGADAGAIRRVLEGAGGLVPWRLGAAGEGLPALLEALEAVREGTAVGCAWGGEEGGLLRMPGRPGISPLDALDVMQAHERILEPLLARAGGSPEGLVTYTRDAPAAVAAVRQGKQSLALFLRPPTVQQVLSVAAAGGRMPEKTTYFFPKVLTGLLFQRPEPLAMAEEA
jgi:uncharacterized protein (DUF1015 family)